jgi:hypothetical protein
MAVASLGTLGAYDGGFMQESEPAQWIGGRWRARGALVLIILFTALRPGDATWINDEPQLLHIAFVCNAGQFPDARIHIPFTHATLAPYGLVGTRGARYGPLPVWIYQIFLAITHDPILMVVMRALICSSITAIALDWLLGTMGWNPWLAVVTMLSPWLWHYSRQLWDNSFCIPLSAMLIAAYADYLKTSRGWAICIAAVAAGLMLLTHLMSLALLIPWGLHLVLRRSNWPGVVIAVALIVAAIQLPAIPYWEHLGHHYTPRVGADRSPVSGFLFPLLGGHHLTATGLGNLVGSGWQWYLPGPTSYIVWAAEGVSAMAYIAVWIGLVRSPRLARRVIRRKNPTLNDHLALIALGVFICQLYMDGTMRVYDGPHYFNATWIAYAIFAYQAFARLSAKWGKRILWAQGVALATVLLAVMGLVAQNGGMITTGYGTSLSQQIDAVRQIGNTPFAGGIRSQVCLWRFLPWEYDTLKEMLVSPDTPPQPGVAASVVFRGSWPGDAHIVVNFVPK